MQTQSTIYKHHKRNIDHVYIKCSQVTQRPKQGDKKSHPTQIPECLGRSLAAPPLTISQGEETNTDTASVRDYRKQSPYNPNSMQHRRCCIKGTHGHRPQPRSGNEIAMSLRSPGPASCIKHIRLLGNRDHPREKTSKNPTGSRERPKSRYNSKYYSNNPETHTSKTMSMGP